MQVTSSYTAEQVAHNIFSWARHARLRISGVGEGGKGGGGQLPPPLSAPPPPPLLDMIAP